MKACINNGIDNLYLVDEKLRGKRLGLVTGPTGVSRDLQSTIDILNEKYNLTCLFSAEHGIRGNAQAGDKVGTSIDGRTGLPVCSLYGQTRHAAEDALSQVDTVVFDMQDVGLRFYTYLYTLTNMMEDCAKYKIPLIVLDHINPLSGIKLEGTMLDERFSSFVGKYALPTRYAMTIGEFASYINSEKSIACDLTVCPCSGWKRDMYYDDTDLIWIQPSPNMPTIETALCYTGSCMFEGTNLSEGRGTTKPFEIIGAPWLNAYEVIEHMQSYNIEGVKFRETYFNPTFSKYAGQVCCGVQLHITNRDVFESFKTSLLMLDFIRKNYNEFEFLEIRSRKTIELLLGTDAIFRDDFEPLPFIESEKKKLDIFKKEAQKYLIYS
ncbi:MAG: DUF1343 domain-containing protein [Bacillota bacterium]|nr:DUF1343 domain-containing protein [Bacillota bacterium]